MLPAQLPCAHPSAPRALPLLSPCRVAVFAPLIMLALTIAVGEFITSRRQHASITDAVSSAVYFFLDGVQARAPPPSLFFGCLLGRVRAWSSACRVCLQRLLPVDRRRPQPPDPRQRSGLAPAVPASCSGRLPAELLRPACVCPTSRPAPLCPPPPHHPTPHHHPCSPL